MLTSLIYRMLLSLIIIAIGILIKRSLIVVNDSLKKRWGLFVIIGCIWLILNLLLFFLKYR